MTSCLDSLVLLLNNNNNYFKKIDHSHQKTELTKKNKNIRDQNLIKNCSKTEGDDIGGTKKT